jgi:hypothetical protein
MNSMTAEAPGGLLLKAPIRARASSRNKLETVLFGGGLCPSRFRLYKVSKEGYTQNLSILYVRNNLNQFSRNSRPSSGFKGNKRS